jgi:zinc/manganese transport system permease protein
VIVWLGLGIAFFSIYPVGFYVTSIAFAVFLLARLTRSIKTTRSG